MKKAALRVIAAGLAIIAVATLAACDRSPLPDIAYPISACPQHKTAPAASDEAGSAKKLVPFSATHAVLCRYQLSAAGTKSARSLAASVSLDATATNQFVAQLNRDDGPPLTGTYNCPNDTGGLVDGFFWSKGHHIEVAMTTSGCATANNGVQTNAFTGKSNIESQLAAEFRTAP